MIGAVSPHHGPGDRSREQIVTATGFSDADFARHLDGLKKRLPHGDFHVVVQKPFVVIGDESKEMVNRRSNNPVKWAVEMLKKEYFHRNPGRIIDIWLFNTGDC